MKVVSIIKSPAFKSLFGIVLFAVIFHHPLFFQDKTVSAFDLAYFHFNAYEDSRPAETNRASNALLSDPVLCMHPWDMLMYGGDISFPWLWNPYAGCGAPMLGNSLSSPLFPLKWISYPFGLKKGFGVLCFLKMLLAGLLSWMFLGKIGCGRIPRMLGSAAFMAGGFVVAWLQYSISSAAVLLPLFLLGCEYLIRRERNKGIFTLLSASVLIGLAGHPETTFHTLVVSSIYLIAGISVKGGGDDSGNRKRWIKTLGLFAAVCLLGFVIASVQIIPTLEYLFNSAELGHREDIRHRIVREEWFFEDIGYSLEELILYIMPNARGNPSMEWGKTHNFNESAGYTGAGVLLLSILGWRFFRRDRYMRTFCVLQAFSLFIILHLHFFRLNPQGLPVFHLVNNERLLFVFCFSNAVLAALVLDRFMKSEKVPRGTLIFLWTAAAVLFVFALAFYFRRFGTAAGDTSRTFGAMQLIHLSWTLFPWLTLSVFPLLAANRRKVPALGLTVLAAADLFVIFSGYNPYIAPEHIYPETKAIKFLQSKDRPVRVLPLKRHIGPNILALYGIQDPRLYDAVTVDWYNSFLKKMGGETWWNTVENPKLKFAETASVRYLWGREDELPGNGGIIYREGDFAIAENPDALPYCYVNPFWRSIDSPEEALAGIGSQSDDGPPPVYVEDGASIRAGSVRDSLRAAEIEEHRAHYVKIGVPPGVPGMLVLNDTFYPGWKAFCDGQRREIYRVNGTFRGVWIDGNTSTVEFVYRPMSFKASLFLSGGGIIIALFLGVKPGLFRSR